MGVFLLLALIAMVMIDIAAAITTVTSSFVSGFVIAIAGLSTRTAHC